MEDFNTPAYRRDIEGLRALAVIPVLLYHARLFGPGGFIGVDVFFVISGYLITQILEGEFLRGRFPLVTFYRRRITEGDNLVYLDDQHLSSAGAQLLNPDLERSILTLSGPRS